jgi:hypothetical protein
MTALFRGGGDFLKQGEDLRKGCRIFLNRFIKQCLGMELLLGVIIDGIGPALEQFLLACHECSLSMRRAE